MAASAQPCRAFGSGEGGVSRGCLCCQSHGGRLHGGVESVLHEEIADVLPGKRKQHVVDK